MGGVPRRYPCSPRGAWRRPPSARRLRSSPLSTCDAPPKLHSPAATRSSPRTSRTRARSTAAAGLHDGPERGVTEDCILHIALLAGSRSCHRSSRDGEVRAAQVPECLRTSNHALVLFARGRRRARLADGVFVGGTLIGAFEEDEQLERNAILVQLSEDPKCHLGRLAEAFGLSTERLRRLRRDYEAGGLEALRPGRHDGPRRLNQRARAFPIELRS